MEVSQNGGTPKSSQIRWLLYIYIYSILKGRDPSLINDLVREPKYADPIW
jgi:hypothetical protein